MAFVFSLERILAWRRIEHRREEVKLAQLAAALEQMRGEIQEVEQERLGVSAIRPDNATGEELTRVARYRDHLGERRRQLEAAERAEREKVEQQRRRVVAADRAKQMLEDRCEREREEWSAGERRRIDQEADEFFLARWPPAI